MLYLSTRISILRIKSFIVKGLLITASCKGIRSVASAQKSPKTLEVLTIPAAIAISICSLLAFAVTAMIYSNRKWVTPGIREE